MRQSERIAEQIEVLAKDLTSRGREIFDAIDRVQSNGGSASEAAALFGEIDNESDGEIIAGLLNLKIQMHSEMLEEMSQEAVNPRLAQQAILRAAELEGSKDTRGMTGSKAVEILKSHGEDPPAGLDLSRRYDIPPS